MNLRKLFLASLAAVLFASTARADYVLIDGYRHDDGGNSIFNLNQGAVGVSEIFNDGLNTDWTIGGQRIAKSHKTGGIGINTVSNNQPGFEGSASFDQSGTTAGHFHFYYGYDSYNSVGAANFDPLDGSHVRNDLDADLLQGGIYDKISLNVIFADQGGGFTIRLVSDQDGSSNGPQVATLTSSWGAAGVTDFRLDFNYADFLAANPLLDLTDIDQIIINSGDHTSAQIIFDNIAAIPEPGSMAMVGLLGGVGLVVGWRRRKAAAAKKAE